MREHHDTARGSSAPLRLSLSNPHPVLALLALVFMAALLHTSGTAWPWVAAAAAVGTATAIASLLLPWERLPVGATLVLPLGIDAVVACMRQAQGGSTSGYGSLSLLPVVWVGLVLGRRALATMVVATAALFVVPLAVVGAPLYPASGWRGALLITITAAVIGAAGQRIVEEQRRQTDLAHVRAQRLDLIVRTQSAIASADFDLDEVETTIVEEALRLTRADAAVLELPDGPDLVYTAVAGTATKYRGLRLQRATAISGLALRTLEVLVCDDSDRDPRVDGDACRSVGARSMVVVPLVHGEGAVGVLKVYSETPHAFGTGDIHVLEALAGMIGTALVRADLIRTLNEYAARDALTGVLNRRRWREELDLGLARARRAEQPLSVVVFDLDGLKIVNDSAGHAAGDRLLCRAADAWTSVLRTTDLLGRIGGDEFAVLLEGADDARAREIVDRLHAALGDGATASAGTATWDGVETAETLLERADEEMYAAKRAVAGSR